MNPCHDYLDHLTRRQFFAGAGLAMGGVALNWLAPRLGAAPSAAGASVHPSLAGFPHFAPKAKRIIYLHMNGGPSQLDTFDYKPGLQARFNEELPDSIRQGQRITTMTSGQARFPVAPSQFAFAQHGKSGTWVERVAAVDGQGGGRHRRRSQRAHERDQPRSRVHLPDDGQ
jgi:hypothetical protein